MNNSLLNIKNISKKFEAENVINNFSLNIVSNKIYIVHGQNGTGKSTLLKMVAGILDPDEGIIKKYNNSINNIGYSSSNFNAFFHRLKLIDNLIFFIKTRGFSKKESIEKIYALFDKLNLNKDILRKKYANLSAGEKKKASIIRALAHEPFLIVLDEPFVSIDEEFHKSLVNFILSSATNDRAFIISTHDFKFLEKFDSLNIQLLPDAHHIIGNKS